MAEVCCSAKIIHDKLGFQKVPDGISVSVKVKCQIKVQCQMSKFH